MTATDARNGLVRRVRRRVNRQCLKRHWRLDIVKTRAGTELVRNWWIDRRYGGSCGGATQTSFAETGAYGTSSADYWQLRRIFSLENGLAITPSDVLVDIGCGKGRVLNHWLEQGQGNRIVGIELDPRFAGFARDRLAGHANVEVLCGDALELLPADATIFFLFNPFGSEVVRRFRDRVAVIYPSNASLTIVYYFALHRNVFDEDSRFQVRAFACPVFYPGVTVRFVGSRSGAGK